MKEANCLLYRAKRLCGAYVWEQVPPMAFDHRVADPMVEWGAAVISPSARSLAHLKALGYRAQVETL